jgi:hypothetical protein
VKTGRLAKPSEADIARAIRYFKGELHTSPVPFPFRVSRAEDVTLLSELPEAQQRKAVERALASLRAGEGVFATLAAGASSRMNPAEVPPEAQALVEKLFGQRIQIASKAAVPVGSVDGKIVTFLGAFLSNIARLEQEANVPGANDILILTNDQYADELARELVAQDHYGLSPARFLTPRQPMGFQFVAHAADVRKVKGLSGDERKQAVERAAHVGREIAQGRHEAAILPDERAPLGHADFFHEVLRAGLLQRFLESGKRWISVRNIDNVAGTFDWDWLVSLGLFLEENLDFQAEVSPRIPGQKGGALIVDEKGNHRLAEEPSFDATWEAMEGSLEKKGFKKAPPERAAKLAREELVKNARLVLKPHTLSFEEKEVSEYSDEILLFEKGPERLWLRRVSAEDTYWFNNATGLTRPEFWVHLYGREGATRASFLKELSTASPEEIENIIERGRAKFPVLIDPKPARTQKAVAAKPEANLWQSTLVAGAGARVRAVGVHSVRNLDPERYRTLPPEKRIEELRHLRMLATKQWTGPVESYESNKVFMDDLLKYIFKGPLLR